MALNHGTYQFSYRLINRDTNKQSNFSLLTNQINVYELHTDDSHVYGEGSIGSNSEVKIVLRINFTNKEQSFYDYYQVAVTRNVTGSSVPDTKAFLLSPLPITGDYVDFVYDGNAEETSIDISEINIQNQAISNVKTLTSKLNRLVCGNVSYMDLDYDNGDPVISSSTDVKVKDVGGSYENYTFPAIPYGYADPAIASSNVGYFRDEVYRFGVSYFDEYGNFSEPKVLDFSSAQNNKSSIGVDFKFPKRQDFGYAILGNNNNVQAIGLDLKGLDNHPSWAKGFVIVRLNRKKNIIGQTPVIPSAVVEMPDADGDYPSSTDEGEFTGNPLGTLVPKNFEHGVVKSIVRDYESESYPGNIIYAVDDNNYAPQVYASRHVVYCYIPERLYNNNGETIPYEEINKNDNLEFIDAALLRKTRYSFTEGKDGSIEEGDYIDTSVSTTYSAKDHDYYYYDNVNENKLPLSTISGLVSSIKIKEARDIDNNQSSQSITSSVANLKTSTIGDYQGIKDSLEIGYTPSNMKTTALVLKDPFIDYMYKFLDNSFNSYALNNTDVNKQFEAGNITVSEDTIPNNASLTENGFQTNNFADSTGGGGPVNAVAIANITKGLKDNRYGDISESGSFISTGAVHYFSEEEIELNKSGLSNPIDIEVWGGDCFISIFNSKITDKTYSIMFSGNESNTDLRWGEGSYIDNGSGLNVSRPVAIKNNSQVISIYLESEINGDALPRDSFQPKVVSGNKIAGNDSEKSARTPFDYDYNLSFSLQNSTKTFDLDNSIFKESEDFRSRIIYSDTKIYQSDVEGFDTFRALNYYDIDETNGGITKLCKAGDDLYAIQKNGIAYIPISSRIIETADLDTLSVRSGEFINEPYYLSNSQGTTLIDSVIETKSSILFIDDLNKEVNEIINKNINTISDNGFDSEVKGMDLSNVKIYSLFNESEDEYLFYINEISNGGIYNKKINKWTSRLSLSQEDYLGPIVQSGDDIYSIGYGMGSNTSDIKIYNLFNGDYNNFLESEYLSSIKFVVNELEGVTKVFDNSIINSLGNLSKIQYKTRLNYTNEIDIDIPSKEDLYRVKILRGQSGERIRGVYSDILIKFKDQLASLYSVSTKIRPSYRFKR